MTSNMENMDTINDLLVVANNLKNHTDKYGYKIYHLSKENLFISDKKLTIKEVNQRKCEMLGEVFHYYW